MNLVARLPWTLLLAAAALVGLGLAGLARSQQLDGGRFLQQQTAWTVVAALAVVVVAVPGYRQLAQWSYAIYAVAVALLIGVYFFPAINGAHRWFRVGGFSLQPSELAKVAFVLALARWLMHQDAHRRLRGFVAPMALALAPTALVLRQPDLGTSLVFPPVMFLMLFAAGARTRDLAKVALCGLLVAPLLWTQMSGEQRSRVTALFEQPPPGDAVSDDAYHLHQAKQRLALGGVWGTWLAPPSTVDPEAYHVPEDHCDFIFAVLGERFGWFGVGGALALYGLLVWQGMRIAERTREPFGRLTAVGLSALFGVQAAVNTAMSVGLAPITGMSLPLVSYGGSGLLAHALALGLLTNIALRPGYEVGGEPFRFAAAVA